MQLTTEQLAIINSTGNIKINAVAGSGKTTTLIEYALSRPKNSRILYLAFNKSVKMEAIQKFAATNITNVHIETAHSLAYKNIVPKFGYKIKPQGYKANEIAEILQLQSNGDKHTEYIVANHISKFAAYFCNSDKQKIQEQNYLDTVTEPKAHQFVSAMYDYIAHQTRLWLGKMNSGEIPITHDFYLKKFQLASPTLPYDYILFDEGQDASAAMLDVFSRQKATKLIVGDTNQQIYGWRYAINALENTDFAAHNLTKSFRFGTEIAQLAAQVLLQKKIINAKYTPTGIEGCGTSQTKKSYAVLARTNLGLLLKAIECITENKMVKKIYFEGNINSYTYADEGTSLYDVLNLYTAKQHLIKDPMLKAMKTVAELEEYIDKTEEQQLHTMLEIVKEYGSEIPNILRRIKEKHVENDQKHTADIVFSTIHKCKGMEYDSVQLVNDFITEERLKKQLEEGKHTAAKLHEEINLLYVAITRAKTMVYVPESLQPKNHPNSAHISFVKTITKEEKLRIANQKQASSTQYKPKAQASPAPKKTANAYQSWNEETNEELATMYQNQIRINDIAAYFGRTNGSILLQIRKLGLLE